MKPNFKKLQNPFYPSRLKIFLTLFLSLFLSFTAMTNVINVSDYGAIPNDDIDDTKAIKDAITACDKRGAILNFDRGKYLVQGQQANTPIFSIERYQNLTINGNFATLSCKTWDVVFQMQNCSRIKINRINIDWDRDLPFSYGTITAVSNNYIEVTLKAPQLARAGLKTEAILQYDPLNLRPSINGIDYYQTGQPLTEIVSSNVSRCYVRPGLYFPPDINVIVRHQVYYYDAFSFIKVDDLTVSDVKIYSTPGMALVGFANKNVTINNFQILRKNDCWMSTCADGINLCSTRGTININNCNLQGMGDDGMNIHGIYYKVQYASVNSVCLRDAYSNKAPFWWDAPLKNDTLVVIDSSTMAKKGNVIVVSSSTDWGNDCLQVKYIDTVFTINAGDDIYNKNTIAKLNVTNTIVKNHRSRGLILETSNAKIINSNFSQCSAPAIILATTTGGMFIESSAPQHVTIRDCDFYNCNYGYYNYKAPLIFYTNTTTNQYANAVINDIHINHNVFTTMNDQPAISIRSANNVYLDSNQFSNNNVVQIDYMYPDNDYCNVYVDRMGPTGANAFGGTAVTLPALIEGENFDEGGDGVGYHDVTLLNEGNSDYRYGERVDISDFNHLRAIDHTICSEWVGYTVTVPYNAYYNVIVRGSADYDRAVFHLEKDFKMITPPTHFPNTGNWNIFKSDTIKNVYLTQGTYQIKFVWDNSGPYLDYLKFILSNARMPNPVLNKNITAYPDPFTGLLNITVPDEKVKRIQLFDITSRLLSDANSNRLDNLNSLPAGVYYLQIETNNGKFMKRVVKVK